MEKYGEKYSGDSKYVELCRRLQSIYRYEKGLSIKPYRGHMYGNYINEGKRIIKNVLGKTQAEVREKLKRALEETNGMDVARADDFTVATWLKTWYDLYAKPNVRVATADRYDFPKEID